MQAPCDDVAHLAGGLQDALHLQQPGLEEWPPLPFGEVVPDHHVEHAELVLQGDEGDAAGGLWALPADHQAGDPYRSSMSQFRQFAGVAAAAGLELSTQEFQRMRAEGGAEESVIAQQFLAARRQRQADRGFFDDGPFGEQWQLRLDAGDGPARLVPVSGETAQGAGIGQRH